MPKINVFITVDTEHSIGGAFKDSTLTPVGNEKRVFGKIGDKDYGIPLIIDIANSYNIPLTFFLEVLNKYHFGEKESREVCRYLIGRGHDVQLHLHPNYLNFTRPNPGERSFSDSISNYEFEKQGELIKEGRELLIQYGTKSPIAFRAGNFAADRLTLKALRMNGFLIDSSYNLSHGNSSRRINPFKSNNSFEMEGIFEFPVTNFVEFIPFRTKRFKALDINGVSFQEMKYVLNQARTIGLNNITIILHSFSFIKPYDVQYNVAKPRWQVIRQFEKLCYFLKEESEAFEVKNFGSLDRDQLVQMSSYSTHHFFQVPAKLTLIRYLQELKNRLL
jgi:hypothetical protein